MANEEHLRILLSGVEAWNEWRKSNPAAKPDLTGAILNNVNLANADLREAKLNRANLYGANLFQANLYKADLHKTNLSKTVLVRTDCRNIDLEESVVTENLVGLVNVELPASRSSPAGTKISNNAEWRAHKLNRLGHLAYG